MEHFFAIARATQKALTSAHQEFQRELYTVPKKAPATTGTNTPTPTTKTLPTTNHTPTIPLAELNRLRDAMYAGGR